jgi:long-chain acyl-CoA synthetase
MSKRADFSRVFDILTYQQKKYPQQAALSFQQDGKWESLSIQEIQNKVNRISGWLAQQGFKKGDCIAIIPRMGSPVWMILDFACQQIGLITVPLHPTSSAEEMKFILDEVQAKICIAADVLLMEKVKPVFTQQHLYHLEERVEGFFPPCKPELVEGQTHARFDRLSVTNNIDPTDTLCILYTSGTSGTPKGAVLTHQNIVSNIKSLLPLFPISPSDKTLSFLPFSHIFERTSCYAYMAFGANIYFSQKLETLNHDFRSVRPIFCTTVPKTLERMYEILEEKRQQRKGLERMFVKWAMRVGEQFKSEKRHGFLFGLKLWIARILVLNQWRKALGGKLKFMIVGAAALRPEIARLFSAAGVLTLSGYGMTEASPFITVNRPEPGMHKFGTVGLPGPGVEIKLDNPNENGEGEILVRGPNIMQGYFNRPELNADVFTADGWFRTGDIGKMVNKRFLAITDRKKDIFKTSSGIYVAPQELEGLLTSSPFISQAMVLGFNKPFVVAVLVPHFTLLQTWCEEQGIHWTSPQFMVHNIKVIQKFQQEIDHLNQTLPNYKKVQRIILSETEWTTDSGELTTSLKMIRGRLLEKHKSEFEKLYT